MRSHPRRLSVLVVASVCLIWLSACTADPEPEPPGAAEPAEAPELTVDPVGQIIDLAADPEGMVFDPVTGLLAVAVRDPNRLLLVDGATGQVQTEVALPGHARHLQLAAPGGPVLVPGEDSNALIEVALPSGATTTTAVGDYPHDATQVGSGLVVVGDEMGGTLSVVEGGEVIQTFDDLTQPGGLAPVGDLVGVIDVAEFSLSVYDIAAGERLGRVAAGDGPTHLVADNRGHLLVADTRGDALLSFRADPVEVQATLPLPGTPYGLAYDAIDDVLWVTLTATNEVVGFDMSSGEPRELARFPTVRQPNTVAVDPESGRLFVVGRTTGELQTIQS
ncbi:MAG: YncE family protein [Geodermatophilaceae bacterium]|nr:YncE family protein [Geodermatophilaceae bacterium]